MTTISSAGSADSMAVRGAIARPGEDEPGRVLEDVFGDIRSYDHRGVVFCWQPHDGLKFARAAIDVEAKDAPVAAIAGRFGMTPEVFLQRWTALEAAAKALDLPVLAALRGYGLEHAPKPEWSRFGSEDVWLRAIEHPTHWVTVAIT